MTIPLPHSTTDQPDYFTPTVPAEWTGRARQLINEVKTHSLAHNAALKSITEPLRQRWQQRPQHLQTALHDWQHKLPAFGRFDIKHELNKDSLAIAELRLMHADLAYNCWEDDDYEPSLSVPLIAAHINPGEFSVRYQAIVMAGLHAIARRYERSSNRDTQDLFDDMATVAAQYRSVLAATHPEFTVRCPGGIWRGLRVDGTLNGQGPDHRLLSIRTFERPTLA